MRPAEQLDPNSESTSRPRWSVVLRAVREARGVTQDGWAALLGAGRTTVQRWERGERVPDPSAEASILAYCREAGLFRTYDRGPLAGLTLTAELLADLLADARWQARAEPVTAAVPAPSTHQQAEAPPASAPPPPTNLPVQLTSFIGRAAEIAQVRRVQAGTRLLTLTGAGGCGKTRLALALAEELRWAYPQGVWWADLAPLADPALLPQVVATVLDVRSNGQQTLTEALVDRLRTRNLLLILDNCEHLLPASAEVVEALLRACPNLEVIATSREPLGIAGETVWRVPALSLPGRQEGTAASDAFRLFVERARLQRPDLTLTAEDEAAVAEICRELDGMPLAIELAAARVSVLSVSQIAERLHDRFRLLNKGGRTALPRHQTLYAAMEWSYGLLTAQEQAVVRTLSVFAGGFTLEAAEAVVGNREQGTGNRTGDGSPTVPCALFPVPLADVLDLLARLVDKSLVVADGHSGEVRYRLLETVRQFAAEQLAVAGETAATRARHAAWCLALVEMAWPHRGGPEQDRWLARLTLEHDNLRAALAWSLTEGGDLLLGLRLAGMLGWLWEVRGYHNEGRRWFAALLERTDHMPPDVLARAMEGAGALAKDQGDYAMAAQMFEQSLALRREMGDDAGVAGSLNNLGIVLDMQGDWVQAKGLYEECLELGRKLGDPGRISASLNNLGIVARQRGEFDQALALYEESLAVVRELGDTRRIAIGLTNLANVYRDKGDDERAAAIYRESLTLYQNLGDRMSMARSLQGLAGIAASAGQGQRAARLAGATAALREAMGIQVPAFGRAKFEETVALARVALGEEAFAGAWAEGQALSLDEAVAEALADPD